MAAQNAAGQFNGLPLLDKTAVEVLGAPDARTIEHDHIEAGVLERSQPRRRKFR